MRGGPREGKIQKTSFKVVKIFLRMKPPFFFVFKLVSSSTRLFRCVYFKKRHGKKKAHHRNFLPDGIVFVDRTGYGVGILRDDQRTSIILESILISGWIL